MYRRWAAHYYGLANTTHTRGIKVVYSKPKVSHFLLPRESNQPKPGRTPFIPTSSAIQFPQSTARKERLHSDWASSKLSPIATSSRSYQLRRMDRTLEMLESGSVNKMHVTDQMEGWWAQQVEKTRAAVAKAEEESTSTSPTSSATAA